MIAEQHKMFAEINSKGSTEEGSRNKEEERVKQNQLIAEMNGKLTAPVGVPVNKDTTVSHVVSHSLEMLQNMNKTLLNSVLLLVILCERIQSLNGEALRCKFQDVPFSWGSMYTCHVSSLDNSKNDKVIDSHTGTHLANRNNNDVKAIRIQSSNTKYIPEGLGSLFSLTAFLVEISELIEIKAENFQGMQNLEYLSLGGNKLTSVPSDAFSTLRKLKQIYLGPNRIKYIGSGLFDQLAVLKYVYLHGNICVNKYYNGTNEITKLKEDIITNYTLLNEKDVKFNDFIGMKQNQEDLKKMMEQLLNESQENQMECNEIIKLRAELSTAKDQQKKKQEEYLKVKDIKADCVKPDDIIQYEIEQKISDETSKNREEIKALNGMMKQFFNELKDLKMEHQENINLRAELSTAKDQQKKKQEEIIKVTNEREHLEKKLNEAQETIQQKLPKMEQTINEFHMEVMDQKIECHYKREDLIALRTKLMEAKEQLAECQINERISC
ncbi:unnamed protein product [Diamesa tonsa]